ncbi:MAG TPA: hypothetical protein VKN99_04185, partial [Polyangia bacterium]|nr:hypothetical protein [Polyangia bacterium]
GPVVLPQSNVRGGIRAAGDDVGRYTSIAIGPSQQPLIAYYDVTHGALKLAQTDGTTWTLQTVDAGNPALDSRGFWAALSLRDDGAPGIAYYADHLQVDGSHATELRFAQAKGATPAGASDWTVTSVASGTIPAPPPGGSPPSLDLPPGVGLFPSVGRLADGRPVIAYYDGQTGNLMLATATSPAATSFTLQILDGQDPMGMSTGDVGLYPALAVETGDIVHVAYEDAIHHNLLYLNTHDHKIEQVDDGYRIDGQNAEGLPEPVFHFVGADGGLILMGATRVVFYQDATSHELLMATRGTDGTWSHASIAGKNPQDGAFGFFASAVRSGGNAVVSSYVINQQARPPQFFVQIFLRSLGPP